MIIKNKIKDLQYMFDSCKNLTNIEELKYLNVKYYTNFSHIFNDCWSLTEGKERTLPISLFNKIFYLGLIVVLLHNTTIEKELNY